MKLGGDQLSNYQRLALLARMCGWDGGGGVGDGTNCLLLPRPLLDPLAKRISVRDMEASVYQA
jgi:hypothetical protein